MSPAGGGAGGGPDSPIASTVFSISRIVFVFLFHPLDPPPAGDSHLPRFRWILYRCVSQESHVRWVKRSERIDIFFVGCAPLHPTLPLCGFGFATRTPRFIWLVKPSLAQSAIIPNKPWVAKLITHRELAPSVPV